MMRSALRAIDAHSESTVMIGDRMDTDVVAGMEAGLETILVLTGITTAEQAERFPYRPSRIVGSVADLVDTIERPGRPATGRPSIRRLVGAIEGGVVSG
jgi:NagD protein